MRKFTEVQKHYSAPFSARTEKNDSEYMDFSARLAGLEIQARFENTGLGFLPLHVINNFILRGFVSEAGLKFHPGMKFVM